MNEQRPGILWHITSNQYNRIAVPTNKHTNTDHFPRDTKSRFLSLLQYFCGSSYEICTSNFQKGNCNNVGRTQQVKALLSVLTSCIINC